MTTLLPLAAVDVSGLTWRAGTLVVSLFQPLFWAALGAGFVLASIHLISMLATRWGDRRASGKSLAFSAGLHVSVLIGTIALLPDYRPRWFADIFEENPPVQVRAVLPADETPSPSVVAGNTPVWDQLQESPDVPMTRVTRDPVPVDEPTVAERPDRTERAPFELDRDDTLPDKPREVPDQIAAAEFGEASPAAVPMAIDDPVAEARESAAATAMSRDRSRPVSNALTDLDRDLPTVDRITRGAVERSRETYNPDATIRSLPAARSERATLASAESETIMRRDGPAPSDLPIDRVGFDDPRRVADSQSGGPAIPRRNQTRSRVRPLPSARPDVAMVPTREPTRPTAPRVSNTPATSAFDGFDIDQPRLTETPEFARASLDALRVDDDSRLPAEYQLRTSDGRLDAARKFGGNEQSEQAVERSLKFLAGIQEPEGYWPAEKFGAGRGVEAIDDRSRPNVGSDADAGVTALSVLAYLGAGSTHQQGPYRQNVEKALRWLIANQRDDGYLGGIDVSEITGAYGHAMAMFAIAEASAMQQSESPASRGFEVPAQEPADWLVEPLKRAVAYTLSAQLPDGGWRYIPRQSQGGDMSIFGWHLMGLKSAELAGLEIPDTVRAGMVYFLKNRAIGDDGGLAGYRPGDNATPAMTAEALFCKQMLGMRRENAASDEAVAYILNAPPKLVDQNFYYWYYGTLALYQYGGEPWAKWNERVRDLLVGEQEADGSWDPKGPWGPYGGRIYSTALATLSLEVYYRYLPLYKAGGQYRESR